MTADLGPKALPSQNTVLAASYLNSSATEGNSTTSSNVMLRPEWSDDTKVVILDVPSGGFPT